MLSARASFASQIGQRVAIPWLGGADGSCEFCVKGHETFCVNPTFIGYTVDGGYREYSIARADFVGIVPEGVDPLDAAPLTCAGVTTYAAVKAAKVGPADLVGQHGELRSLPRFEGRQLLLECGLLLGSQRAGLIGDPRLELRHRKGRLREANAAQRLATPAKMARSSGFVSPLAPPDVT